MAGPLTAVYTVLRAECYYRPHWLPAVSSLDMRVATRGIGPSVAAIVLCLETWGVPFVARWLWNMMSRAV